MEEILKKLEELSSRITAIEHAISPAARMESGKIAFGGGEAMPEYEPAIPNTMFDVPSVPMDIEKRVEGLEIRVAALEDERHGPKITPFNLPAPVSEPQEPAIPNTLFQVPAVPIAQAVYLAYIRRKDGSEGWYGLRHSGAMGEVVPYPPRIKAVAERCGTYKDGDYTVVSFGEILSVDDTILRKVRNPVLPIPTGCKVAEDEWSLIQA